MNCDWILLLGTAIEFVDQRSLYLLHFDHISYYAKQLMHVFIKKYKTKENLVYMNVKWITEGLKKKVIFISLGLDPPPTTPYGLELLKNHF